MQYGDDDWRRLTEAIAREDAPAVAQYNTTAPPARRLAALPVPFMGPVMTAPVMLLLAHPALDARVEPADYGFQRRGWPLAPLHAEAPRGLWEWWQYRLAALVDDFGEQHVANAVAALFLTPWPSESFDLTLRLPSRHRMLALAASAAQRDAVILLLRGAELWTEHPDIASLPPSRRFYPRSWRTTCVNRNNLGDTAWETIRKRVGVHAWL
jgi:hypothetical protein